MNSKEFSLTIEGIVKEKRITYMDAVVWYCDENGLDTSQISSLVSKSLKEKIQVEATNKNMLKMPKIGVLPT
jgi:transposase-like protein|tara:strand:- start:444 stop:659 length:216 start_codon:yes stop_codon:yes gene_type:complete